MILFNFTCIQTYKHKRVFSVHSYSPCSILCHLAMYVVRGRGLWSLKTFDAYTFPSYKTMRPGRIMSEVMIRSSTRSAPNKDKVTD